MPNTELLYEKALRLLCDNFNSSNSSYPSWLFLNTRIGALLYDHDYPNDVVIAGLLNNTMEITSLDYKQLVKEFSPSIAKLVQANTTDDSIPDEFARQVELINNCVEFGEAALIIKAAQILTCFRYYTKLDDQKGVDNCRQNCHFLRSVLPDHFKDEIFPHLFKKVLGKS